jgi:Mrp family chromosome partitioning ATPase
MVDANLWSRLVDGTLLVVREGTTPVGALKRGLQSLDNPKLVGVVLNEASEFDQIGQYDRYYRGRHGENGVEKNDTAEGIT